MDPFCFRAIRSQLSTMRLRPCDIFVTENLEEDVRRVIRQLPGSLFLFPRSFQNMDFTDQDGEVVLVSRSFLNIPAVTAVSLLTAAIIAVFASARFPAIRPPCRSPPPRHGRARDTTARTRDESNRSRADRKLAALAPGVSRKTYVYILIAILEVFTLYSWCSPQRLGVTCSPN